MANYQMMLEGAVLAECKMPSDRKALLWADKLIDQMLENGDLEDEAPVSLFNDDRLVSGYEQPN